MDCSTPGFPVHHQLPEFAQTQVHWVSDIESGPSNYLILCCPLLLLPSIFPSIRVFSNESILHIRCPEYFSFSFSISPSNEYLGLISFRTNWFDLLAVQGTLKRFCSFPSPHWLLLFLYSNCLCRQQALELSLTNTKELMLLNCGVGEDSWEALELQGDPTSQS